MFLIKGICKTCNQQAYFDGDNCICLTGYVGNGQQCDKDPNFVRQALGAQSNGGGGSINITPGSSNVNLKT